MKELLMQEQFLGNDGWHASKKPVPFRRVSRWIAVRNNYSPAKRNPLWDYAEDENGYTPAQENFNPENGLRLNYFPFRGRNYALGQFARLGGFWTPVTYSYRDKDGKEIFLSGYDSEDSYNPLYVELDDFGERVRVYEAGHASGRKGESWSTY